MPDLALRGIPDQLHRELKAAARRNHRSLNGEILARLAASVRMAPVEAAVLLERIRRRNRALGPVNLDETALARLRDEGLAILLVEQSTQRAFEIADFVCVLESGREVWSGTAEDARTDRTLVDAYLGLAG